MTGKPRSAGKPTKASVARTNPPADEGFDVVVQLIDAARQRANQAVNTALIELYWQIGEHISDKVAAPESGARVVDRLAPHIARAQPGLRGASPAAIFSECGSSTRPTSRPSWCQH